MQEALLVTGVLVVGMLLFGLLYFAIFGSVGFAMSFLSGWRRAAKHYAVAAHTRQPTVLVNSCSFGMVAYRQTMEIGADAEVLDLRVAMFGTGHAPLRIPWSDVEEVGRVGQFHRVRLGRDGPVMTIATDGWEQLVAMRT